ncbi:MAG: hypothetical protein LBV15_02715, partial [Planctomycetota bacterium]|nr:hypothetical protein [Planctomycetota bacterium]
AVLYTTNEIPVPDYPAACVQALAWRLAANIALSKRADPQLAQAMLGAAGLALGQAKLRDAAETGPRLRAATNWERVRHGG